RSQSAGERQSLFLIHWNLRNAANLVLDRVFNGDDLVFIGLDFVHRGVKRGRLAAARRPRHQHHAVRLFNIAAKLAQVFLVKTNYVQSQRAELLAHRLFVEHAEHSVFTMNRRHDGNAEVDRPAVVLDAETPVLRHASLRDVELTHNLDARDHGRMMLLANRRHGLCQHAVDAELDHHRVIAGLDVNVGSAPLQRRKNRGIDQPDNRTGVARRRQLVDGKGFFGACGLVLANDSEAFAGLFQHALRLLGLLQNVRDLLQRGNLGDDTFAQEQADLVDHHQLAGIGDRNRQPPVRRLFERYEVVAEHQVNRNLLKQIVMKLEVRQVHKFAAITSPNVLRGSPAAEG